MADPVIKAITQWVWTKVITNVVTCEMHRLNTLVDYYRIYKETGGSAPSAPTVGVIPAEAVRMFVDSSFEDIEHTPNFDVYVMGASRSESSNIGSIEVGTKRSEYDTNEQSQTLPLFQYFLMNEQKTDITLTTPIAVDDEVINVSSGHGFTGSTAGEYIVIRSGDIFTQMEVKSVASDAITVEMPIDTPPFPITSSVIRGNILLNVNGSSIPVDFKYTSDKDGSISPIVPIDLSTIVITMQHSSAGADALFGNLSALTNGFYFRKTNSAPLNFGNYKNNQKFRDLGALVEYTDKAGGTNHATSIVFDMKKVFTQEVRLDPREADSVLGKVRDNIVLVKFTVSLIGSFTSGE